MHRLRWQFSSQLRTTLTGAPLSCALLGRYCSARGVLREVSEDCHVRQDRCVCDQATSEPVKVA